MEFVKMELLQ